MKRLFSVKTGKTLFVKHQLTANYSNELRGSKTHANLKEAFAGESMVCVALVFCKHAKKHKKFKFINKCSGE